MKMIIRLVLVLFAFGLLTACGDDDNLTYVRQVTMYGTTLGHTDLGTSDLVLLNSRTGEYIRTIGDTGYYVNGLAYDTTTGTLFATTSANDPIFPAGLIEIDTATGAGTPIGTGLGVPEGDAIVCLAVNAAGQLYGWWEAGEDDLVTVDKVTGLASAAIGDSGLSTGSQGMDFDANGILYLVNSGGEVYTIDTATGASTLVGDIGVTAHHGKFHPLGDYVGIDQTGTGDPTRNLIAADLESFEILDTAPTLDYLHTIAFVSRWIPVSM
ncbi:MAG: hypothetical protein PHO83_03945 [Geobacteraceae bacterium]|nr:hypothetical protein [Geobacteraceae bacterium]